MIQKTPFTLFLLILVVIFYWITNNIYYILPLPIIAIVFLFLKWVISFPDDKNCPVIATLLFLSIFADLSNTVLLKYYSVFSVSKIFRGLMEIYFLFLLLIRKPENENFWLRIFVIMGVAFISILSMIGTQNIEYYFNTFNSYNKFIFFFVCLEVFQRYFITNSERQLMLKVFLVTAFVQISVIIISFIFDIELFSPFYAARFGYAGIMAAQNENATILFLFLFFFLYRFEYLKRGILLIFATLAACFFTGMKSIVTLAPITLLIYLVRKIFVEGLQKKTVMMALISTFMVILFYFQQDYILLRIEKSLNYYEYRFTQEQMYLTEFLFGRFYRFIEAIDMLQGQENFILIMLFGGIDITELSTESDIGDLILRTGIVGSCVLLAIYFKTICSSIIEDSKFMSRFFEVAWVIFVALAGHIIFSAIIGQYLALLLSLLSWNIFKDSVSTAMIMQPQKVRLSFRMVEKNINEEKST